jgi:hypothetical protein
VGLPELKGPGAANDVLDPVNRVFGAEGFTAIDEGFAVFICWTRNWMFWFNVIISGEAINWSSKDGELVFGIVVGARDKAAKFGTKLVAGLGITGPGFWAKKLNAMGIAKLVSSISSLENWSGINSAMA